MEQQATAPSELRNVVNFLRSGKAGIKVRVGVLNGKRIDYFKALLTPAYAKLKKVPKVTTEEEATQLLSTVNTFAFYLRVERGQSASSSSPRPLQINPMQMFQPTDYYAWFYEGSQWTTYVGGVAMVAIMLAGVMFPLWPPIMRLGVWYLSIGVLGLIGLFFAIAIVRLIFYIITIIVASPGIWIFPKLFADVGFVESFIPLWEWDEPKKKSKKKRTEKSEKPSKRTKDSATTTAVSNANGSSHTSIREISPDSGSSRPESRAARVEDVPEEDS
ncbi:hypothetical protein EUX98_g3570 [Antrodiella citrinella]|uniref:Translocation protein SEC62 n=1 Tax=Antrodiella citrinella TaxID=2447956 RepID=A0A4S4N4B4_9APHY|nr:hypothetical protein EUX98_g3570 [Antrodiella citrinella]